jgi:hypothetical protein
MIEEIGQKKFDAFCQGWCDGGSGDWCSSLLGVGGIVGIAVGAAVVVAGVAGVLVYFLVLKKKPATVTGAS